tara:strand:- start:1920 stop:2147 length:228 start_codon:yes stop_codon:yes gene_type:complete
MKNFFEGIAWLFEEVFFIPFAILRDLELTSWTIANSVNWIFLLVGFSAMVYWILQLNLFDKNGEEDKDPSAHSFL